MSTRLIANGIWRQITKAASANGASADVAVAYFSAGASKLLPLKRGSRLVVDFSDRAVKSGQTCPADILKLIRAGVDVYNVPNLHAKVFVFRDRAFIGSTNVSRSSASVLVEAVVGTDDRRLIASMRKFVHKLCLNWVTVHEAKQMLKLYKPPKFAPPNGAERQKSKRIIAHPVLPPIRITQLNNMHWDEEQWNAHLNGKKVAKKQIKDSRHFTVDDFLIEGHCEHVRRDIVIRVTNVGHRKKLVSPPAKVVHLQRVPNRRPMETIVFLETPKQSRRKNLKIVIGQLGGKARELLNCDHVIRDRSFVEKLLSQWHTPQNNR